MTEWLTHSQKKNYVTITYSRICQSGLLTKVYTSFTFSSFLPFGADREDLLDIFLHDEPIPQAARRLGTAQLWWTEHRTWRNKAKASRVMFSLSHCLSTWCKKKKKKKKTSSSLRKVRSGFWFHISHCLWRLGQLIKFNYVSSSALSLTITNTKHLLYSKYVYDSGIFFYN